MTESTKDSRTVVEPIFLAPLEIITPASSKKLMILDSDCPPGLEHLAPLDGLYVHQLMEMIEILTGIETSNRYEVMDGNGLRIFFAAETTNPGITLTNGSSRPFVIQLLNSFAVPILTMTRECSCSVACCCGCCGGNKVDVTHISGVFLGSAIQNSGCCTPTFKIIDETGHICFIIRGPCCACCVDCCVADFHILLPDGMTEIGIIQKQASTSMSVSDANTFGVTFPPSLSPKMKGLILAAVFAIDFGFFESSSNPRRRRRLHSF